jgi:hypothetical protein
MEKSNNKRRSGADLGQKEAETEKMSDEKLEHMGRSEKTDTARQPKKEADLGQEKAELEKAREKELDHLRSGQARGKK